jgi:site-specific DNA recombinase
MRAGVIYARYSEGPHQTDQSIEGQVADCRAYAAREGIQVIEVYADRHVSGKSTAGRCEFLRMIDDAKQGRFDCCIVWKVDRFGRDRRDIAIYKHKLKEAGVKLMYAEESVPDGPEGIILESVLEGLAEYYSADLRQKVMRGIRETAKKGEWTYDLPIGYKHGADRHIVVDEERAELVREAFRLHIAGATTAELQELFSSHGVTGQRGGKISAGAIFRMLRNEKYTGKFEIQGVLVPAEPIIDEATFTEAAKHFKTSRNNAAGKAKTEYLLSCTCYCAYCGRMLTGDAGHGKSGKVYHYYKCKNKDCTELKPVPKNKLEEAVLYATLRDMLTDDMIDQLTDKILEIQARDEAADPAASFKRQLDSNRKKQQNIITAIEDGAGAGLVRRLNELEAEEQELEGKIAELAIKKPPLTRKLISAWLNSFKAGDVEDPAFQRRLLDTFVARVDVKNGETRVYYNVSGEGSDTISVVERPAWKPNTTEMISRDFIVHHFYF